MKLVASLLACAALLAGVADASAAKKEKDKPKEAPCRLQARAYRLLRRLEGLSQRRGQIEDLLPAVAAEEARSRRRQSRQGLRLHLRAALRTRAQRDLVHDGLRSRPPSPTKKKKDKKPKKGDDDGGADGRRSATPSSIWRQGQRSLDQEPGRGGQGDRRNAQGRQARHQGRRAQGRPRHRHLFAVGLQSGCGQGVERLPGKLIAGGADEILNLLDLA